MRDTVVVAIDDRTRSPADVIRAMVAMFATGDLANVGDLIDSSYVDHQDKIGGPDGFATIVAGARAQYDELDVVVADLIEQEDRVAVRLRWLGRRPSGEIDERETLDIIRMVNGRAVEHWGGPSSSAAAEGPWAADHT